ncbi:hypothetical protein CHS0354_003211 [Potamilus streckersoni]|uniref:Uncharacterized protein n=1 Tax=Potamilus streckersoni TaxID=2493646 RepID=A0AAE0SJC5_9BIVA|nr:hypothetical protein CHS0354_003211 [Potamilus streckersoni]
MLFVTMSSECSESICRSISNCTHLQDLILYGITLHDNILFQIRLTSISNCTHLQTLHLDNTQLDGILDLSRLTNLTSLGLWNVTMSSECIEFLCGSISNCTHLQILDLIGIALYNSILDPSRLTNLTSLSLWNVTMSSECIESLCGSISNCIHLQALTLYGITLNDSILDLSRQTNLTYLMLENVTMSSKCSESLYRSISNCTHLQELYLDDITLNDSILDQSRLTHLRLENVSMSSECSESM